MDRNNPGICYPLEMVKKVTDAYPDIWKKVEEAHRRNAVHNYSEWPEWCYLPFVECMDIVCEVEDVTPAYPEIVKYGNIATIIHSLASWRVSKEIFVMDPDIEQILSEQTDVNVDSEILMKLPYYCFYIKTNHLSLDNRKELDGFFVSLEYDLRDSSGELRINFLYRDLTFIEIPLLLKYKTLEETIDYLLALTVEESRVKKTPGKEEELKGYFTELRKTMVSALQMVLYILSINSDIEENPVQKKIYRRSVSSKEDSAAHKIKDKYAEVRMWDVGYRIGASVRANRQKREGSISGHSGSHSSKRPHLRRGHWHNFWVGPRTSKEGNRDGREAERKLVLRWIPPTFIGGGKIKGSEEMPVVYHEVK